MESAASSRKIKTKGRGHTEIDEKGKYDHRDGVFESIGKDSGSNDGGPLQCKIFSFDLFIYVLSL